MTRASVLVLILLSAVSGSPKALLAKQVPVVKNQQPSRHCVNLGTVLLFNMIPRQQVVNYRSYHPFLMESNADATEQQCPNVSLFELDRHLPSRSHAGSIKLFKNRNLLNFLLTDSQYPHLGRDGSGCVTILLMGTVSAVENPFVF